MNLGNYAGKLIKTDNMWCNNNIGLNSPALQLGYNYSNYNAL